MVKRRHTPEQVINRLREAEVELAKGTKVPEVWGAKTPSAMMAPAITAVGR